MHNYIFDAATNGIELSWRDTGSEIPRCEARPVYAEEHVLRAKIEELKDNNCPLFR